jgi:hypothetical protein
LPLGIVDTGGKFAIGINNTSGTGGTAGVVNIGGARKYAIFRKSLKLP